MVIEDSGVMDLYWVKVIDVVFWILNFDGVILFLLVSDFLLVWVVFMDMDIFYVRIVLENDCVFVFSVVIDDWEVV